MLPVNNTTASNFDFQHYYDHGCHRSGNGQGEKIIQGQGKVRKFYFESWKIDILYQGKVKEF